MVRRETSRAPASRRARPDEAKDDVSSKTSIARQERAWLAFKEYATHYLLSLSYRFKGASRGLAGSALSERALGRNSALFARYTTQTTTVPEPCSRQRQQR